jgi:hypothetical protein
MAYGEIVRTKKCSICRNTRRIKNFRVTTRGNKKPPEKRTSSSYEPFCLDCSRKRMKERISKYRESNPRDYYNSFRSWKFRTKYGITISQYDAMYESQEGCCKICLRHASETKRGLVVDHDHEVKRARSLLCDSCNRGLGMFQDNPEILSAAVSYLQYHHSVRNTDCDHIKALKKV